MIYTHSGNLPYHMDILADAAFFSTESGFVPVRWFGLSARYGKMWGCHLMLECGAVYRNVPPHALAFNDKPMTPWHEHDAQMWDCFGAQFTTLVYGTLEGLDCVTSDDDAGMYLFTAVSLFDGFSRDPRQSKEFMFIKLDNGRLSIRSTDHVLFKDKSFTDDNATWPDNLKRQTEEWSCEK